MKKILILAIASQLVFASQLFAQFTSNTSVINFLNGKKFLIKEHYNNGMHQGQTLEFKGMEEKSDNPFKYNPYPNASDFSGKVWEFAANRYLFTETVLEMRDSYNKYYPGYTKEYCIYSVSFTQNGGAKLTYRSVQRSKIKDSRYVKDDSFSGQHLEWFEKDVVNFGPNVFSFYLFTLPNDGTDLQPKAGIFSDPNTLINDDTYLNY